VTLAVEEKVSDGNREEVKEKFLGFGMSAMKK